MKTKVVFFSILLSFLLTFVFCEEKEKKQSSFSLRMPYIGAKGGVIQSRDHHELSSSTRTKSQDEGLLGGIGGIYTGAGLRWKSFYIGPDVDFMWTGASETTRASDGEYTYAEINMFTSLRAKLGYYLHPKTLLYIESGYSWNQFKKDHTRAANAGSYNISSWLGGPILGIGTDLFIFPSIGINLDFLFVWPETFHYSSTNSSTGILETLQDTNRISLFTVGLFYNF